MAQTAQGAPLSNDHQETKRKEQAWNLGKALSVGLKGALAAQIFTACTALPPSGPRVIKVSDPAIVQSQHVTFEKSLEALARAYPTFPGLKAGNLAQTNFLPYFPAWNLKEGDPFKLLVYAPDGTLETSHVEPYGEVASIYVSKAGLYKVRVETMDGEKYYQSDMLIN